MKGKFPVVLRENPKLLGELTVDLKMPASVKLAAEAHGLDQEAQENLIGQVFQEILTALSGWIEGDFDL